MLQFQNAFTWNWQENCDEWFFWEGFISGKKTIDTLNIGYLLKNNRWHPDDWI